MIFDLVDRIVTRHSQSLAVLVGFMMLGIANRMWEIDRLVAEPDYLSGLWPYWFLAGGVLTLAWAIWPWSRPLLATSGAFVVSGMVARATFVLFEVAESGSVLSQPALHVAGIVWTGLAFVLAYTWIADFMEVSALRRRIRERGRRR